MYGPKWLFPTLRYWVCLTISAMPHCLYASKWPEHWAWGMVGASHTQQIHHRAHFTDLLASLYPMPWLQCNLQMQINSSLKDVSSFTGGTLSDDRKFKVRRSDRNWLTYFWCCKSGKWEVPAGTVYRWLTIKKEFPKEQEHRQPSMIIWINLLKITCIFEYTGAIWNTFTACFLHFTNIKIIFHTWVLSLINAILPRWAIQNSYV